MTDRTNRIDPELSAQAADEVALAHHGLSFYFARIEAAFNAGDMPLAVRLLGNMIEQVREHFLQEESLAIGAGRADAADRLSHDAFLERARRLRLMCKRAADNDNPAGTVGAPIAQSDLQRGLVLLMSDLVESDVRLQKRLNAHPDIGNLP